MDGFDTQEGVIIIAATNRPDVLDPALLRPGRFDRQITVNLPDVKGREEILRVHSKKVKLAEGVDLDVIARGTPGYSGAELANVINEAALLAARRGLKGITLRELEEARDKVRWGKERRSMAMSEKEKTNTAYHEAGHALLLRAARAHRAAAQGDDHPARAVARFHHVVCRRKTNTPTARTSCSTSLVVNMGGRVAEEIVFGDVTNGASGDIKQATNIARRMVCEWGMSEKMGMVEYGEHEEHVFLGRDMGRARGYSEATAEEIDREVRKLIDDAYETREAHSDRTSRQARDDREGACSSTRRSMAYHIQRNHRARPDVEPAARPPASSGEQMKPEKPPKQVVVAPDVNPPLPGGLSGAPA